jgi:hypothetical protein
LQSGREIGRIATFRGPRGVKKLIEVAASGEIECPRDRQKLISPTAAEGINGSIC